MDFLYDHTYWVLTLIDIVNMSVSIMKRIVDFWPNRETQK